MPKPLLAGASSPNHKPLARLKIWRDQHRKLAWQSFLSLFEKPLANGTTIMMLTIAILLPNLLFLGLSNLQDWVNYSDNGLEVSAYLHINAENQSIELLRQDATSWPEVASTEFISPNEAIGLIVHSSDMDEIIQSLPSNPLPPTVLIALNGIDDIQTRAEQVAARLHEYDIVESVSYSASWFSKAQALLGLGKQLSGALAALLALGVMLLVGNTVRTVIEQRSEEIIVAKLVGATDYYVRRPFLYFALWLGLIAGTAAVILSYGCWFVLTYLISPLEKAYNTDISLSGPPLSLVAISLIGAPLLSWLGAWLICNSEIRAIEPE